MPNNAQTYDSFINGNPFNRMLYDFLFNNRDILLPSEICDMRSIMYEAYRICAGILSMTMPEQHIRAVIEQVKAEHAVFTNVILSIVWAVLTAQMKKKEDLRLVVQMLYDELQRDKNFHYWNRFASAFRQFGQQLKPLFPNDCVIVVSDAESAKESLEAAQQLRIATQATTESTVHQTLVFPHVEQFNNNPAKVINLIHKK